MAAPYKTPGVYTEEIVKFPPSIAPVETAIPAFIGYTQKAHDAKLGSLDCVPTRIGSIADYELYFGTGAALRIEKVILDANKNFVSADISNAFYMYDSLRLFYANGGGDCYIVSVGTYDKAKLTAAEITKGLAALEKEDEPTILVFPDNSRLASGSDFYDVYGAALKQCSELKDRVALFHAKADDPHGKDFRSKTGINDLKYGMAYSPWLKVNVPANIQCRDINGKIECAGTTYSLGDLTKDEKITPLLADYSRMTGDIDKIRSSSDTLAGAAGKGLADRFAELESAYVGGKTVANFDPIVGFLFEIARKLDKLVVGDQANPNVAVADTKLKDELKSLIKIPLKGIYSTLIGYDKELEAKVANPAYPKHFDTTPPTAAEWADIFGAQAPAASQIIPAAAADNAAKMDAVLPKLRNLFDQVDIAWLSGVAGIAEKLASNKNDELKEAFPLFKAILSGIQNTASPCPPSGAVAGLVAYVDRTRGVWKAPANVSVTGIIGPTYTFTASELDALNVDPASGKSINAIRGFTGKGTLVFGDRTLAGNDNEWRYINVRRFFNFVEESCKKATMQFVFEPNDANTWVRVQAMIENFLTVQWRQGALQGVKPEHAFYVAVGLGKTMTALDILEGRMIVEIGMAAVRPAEFIVLRFSHMMAQS